MVNVGEYTSPMDPMGIEKEGERGRLYLMQIKKKDVREKSVEQQFFFHEIYGW